MTDEETADVVAHLARYREHLRVMERLLEEPSEPGWSAVLAFYAALHLIQAYLGTKGTRFDATNHGARWSAIQKAPELRMVAGDYKALRGLSEDVRYNPSFLASGAERDAAQRSLKRIESVVVPKVQGKGLDVR